MRHTFYYLFVTHFIICLGNLYEDVGTRQKQRRRTQIKEDVQMCLGTPLAEIGFYVELSTEEQYDPIITVDQQTTSEQHEHIAAIPYYLLKHGVSVEFYHEISMIFKDLPRSYRVSEDICLYTYMLQ